MLGCGDAALQNEIAYRRAEHLARDVCEVAQRIMQRAGHVPWTDRFGEMPIDVVKNAIGR